MACQNVKNGKLDIIGSPTSCSGDSGGIVREFGTKVISAFSYACNVLLVKYVDNKVIVLMLRNSISVAGIKAPM